MIRASFPISPPSVETAAAQSASNHERVYGALLFLVAAGSALTIGALTRLLIAGGVGRFPTWSLACLLALCASYLIAIVATLYLRRFRPLAGARASAMLNGALLVVVPAGTLVGAYGLWKLNRDGVVPRRAVETCHDLSPMLLHDCPAGDRVAGRARGGSAGDVAIAAARTN